MPSLREEQKREQGQNGVKIIISYFCLKIQQKIRKVTAVPASSLLKKNTDSVRSAVDNDMFGTLPDLSMLDVLDV